MKQLQTGEFHGQTNKTITLDGLILTDTEYTQDKVDWHYHENAYFTFILQGNVLEGNKKEIYHCGPGSLLFHNWQDPHYNIKPEGFTRGFHIELEHAWFKNLSFDIAALQGSINISNADARFLFYKIFKETKICDDISKLSVQSLLLEVLVQLFHNNEPTKNPKPSWTNKIKELLHDEHCKSLSLEALAKNLGIHPVHLSRYFPKHFHCGLGEYIRKLRVEKSLALLSNKNFSLTAISFECGFSDQSHFNRCFKDIMGVTPLTYKKLLLR
jgi:AraC family transcriptional regulator